jgi:hypothetical protein
MERNRKIYSTFTTAERGLRGPEVGKFQPTKQTKCDRRKRTHFRKHNAGLPFMFS